MPFRGSDLWLDGNPLFIPFIPAQSTFKEVETWIKGMHGINGETQ
jgi:hypothetical protein